jgi:tRNA(adenine34) deaminase
MNLHGATGSVAPVLQDRFMNRHPRRNPADDSDDTFDAAAFYGPADHEPVSSGPAGLLPDDDLEFDLDTFFMQRALKLAEQAAAEDEVPVGAVIVHGGRVIGAGWNQREALDDPTAHAEMIAITQAATALGDWRLENTTLYATLEPCPMCAGAILQARIPRVVYGARDPKAGAVDSLYRLLDDQRLNHRAQVTPGVLADQCGILLTQFFMAKRRQGKK